MGARSVFVYGTLMAGCANHDVLRSLGAAFVGRARTTTPRTLIHLGPYPAMTADDAGPCPVEGEVWSIEDVRMAALDRFEGCPDLYRRVPLRVFVDESVVDVDTYVYAGDTEDGAVITSGRWTR